MIKQLYKGSFQTQRRVFILRTQAYSERQAFNLFCMRIARIQKVSERIVFNWFKDKWKYKIEIEIEFKQVDDDKDAA